MIAPDSTIPAFRMPWIFLFLLLGLPYCAHSQQGAFPIEKWVNTLSVKADPDMINFSVVKDALCALDSINRCRAIQEMHARSASANARCRIRFYFIRNALSKELHACREKTCPEVNWNIEETKEMLRLAYEIEDPYLIALGNKMIASDYRMLGEYGLAVMHTRIAIEGLSALYTDKPTQNASDYYTLGENLYHTREYRDAIEAFQVALASLDNPPLIPWDTIENKAFFLFLYNTMGLAYQKIAVYDSALIAFDHALNSARELSNDAWIGIVQGNRGDVFFLQEKYDSAKVLLAEDVKRSLEGGPDWADNAANSMQWLARIKTKEGEPDAALLQLREADMQLKKLPNRRYQANIYYGFIEAFEKLGKADSVYAYMQKYLVLHDSIEQQAANAKAEIVEMRLENQENIHKITSLNKEKHRIALIRNFAITLILFASAFGLLLINRARLKMKLKQQAAIKDKAIAEKDSADAKSQLRVFTQHLIEKNSLVETLQEQLLQKEMTDQQRQDITALTQHVILTDDDWAHFKQLFEKVYPGFLLELKNTSPDITVAEQRIAALAKLQITSKEASALLGISPASVNKTRQRLRSRLGLGPEVDLEAHFA